MIPFSVLEHDMPAQREEIRQILKAFPKGVLYRITSGNEISLLS